jgi:hypothetical protein
MFLLLLLARVIPRLIPRSLVQLRKRISESVSKVGRATILFLEYRVLDDGRPDSAMFLITGLKRPVLLLGERPSALTARLLKERGSVGQSRADLG